MVGVGFDHFRLKFEARPKIIFRSIQILGHLQTKLVGKYRFLLNGLLRDVKLLEAKMKLILVGFFFFTFLSNEFLPQNLFIDEAEFVFGPTLINRQM